METPVPRDASAPQASAPPAPSGPSADASTDCDVLVVGGGINGVGIARDLAGRGWRVVLAEQDDLAAHTSSSSTKLIHGGLRYLEYCEFALVRKALQEREVLLKSAPHIMWPLRFVMPHEPSMRPVWMVRIGLFLYDHLAKREWLPASKVVDLRQDPVGAPLQDRYTRGFVYSDGWVDDARLVVLNAIDARQRGARILTRTRCTAAQRSATGWQVSLRSAHGQSRQVSARALVNAAGPWAEQFLRGTATSADGRSLATKSLRLVKGSHIVVPRCFEHDHAYIFQNPDRRIIFAIPYERDFTLIGTTDQEIEGEPGQARIDAAEVAYLCEQASRYFKRAITPADVVWTYAGVRPLLDDASGDPSAVTRDYLLESNTQGAPLLSVWGGKITTFRKLAEEAADDVGHMLGEPRKPWTEGQSLPGGDLSAWVGAAQRPDTDFERLLQAVQARHGWLPPALALRLCRAYGSRIDGVIGAATALTGLGAEVAPGLHEAELHFLMRDEWAVDAQDILWRRSKLGLHYTEPQCQQVAQWLAQQTTAGAVPQA